MLLGFIRGPLGVVGSQRPCRTDERDPSTNARADGAPIVGENRGGCASVADNMT
jgi:hypothetical protein